MKAFYRLPQLPVAICGKSQSIFITFLLITITLMIIDNLAFSINVSLNFKGLHCI